MLYVVCIFCILVSYGDPTNCRVKETCVWVLDGNHGWGNDWI
jgi:hypothetical protein